MITGLEGETSEVNINISLIKVKNHSKMIDTFIDTHHRPEKKTEVSMKEATSHAFMVGNNRLCHKYQNNINVIKGREGV